MFSFPHLIIPSSPKTCCVASLNLLNEFFKGLDVKISFVSILIFCSSEYDLKLSQTSEYFNMSMIASLIKEAFCLISSAAKRKPNVCAL